MQKILTLQELKSSEWPTLLEAALGNNLVSAFLHGDCLMEKYSPLQSPWNISFILRSNSAEDLRPLQDLAERASRSNISFGYTFTADEIISLWHEFPLVVFAHCLQERGHRRGVPIAQGAAPRNELQKECQAELRGFLIQMRHQMMTPKFNFSKTAKLWETKLLPILYGVYFLQTGEYPATADQVYMYLQNIPNGAALSTGGIESQNAYLSAIETLANNLGV
jgi:hypothetical protein